MFIIKSCQPKYVLPILFKLSVNHKLYFFLKKKTIVSLTIHKICLGLVPISIVFLSLPLNTSTNKSIDFTLDFTILVIIKLKLRRQVHDSYPSTLCTLNLNWYVGYRKFCYNFSFKRLSSGN